ncbi:MAG: hypothetical protein HC793_03870, partial [Aquincola sp.]|nr:hypothetical protein [Aquincola sp.]
MSLFVMYFGTDRDYADRIAHHTVVFGPRYRAHIREIFQTGKLSEDMSLYVHRPSVTDPSVAPEGDDTFYVLSPVPHLGHKNPVDWKAMEVELPKGAKVKKPEAAAHLVFGARLRSYAFDKYRTREKEEQKPSLKTLTVMATHAISVSEPGTRKPPATGRTVTSPCGSSRLTASM